MDEIRCMLHSEKKKKFDKNFSIFHKCIELQSLRKLQKIIFKHAILKVFMFMQESLKKKINK